MSRAIWKYPLQLTDRQVVEMPAATIRHVGMQAGVPCIWAEVTPGASTKQHTICMFGTGNPIELMNGHYLGTVQLAGGSLVFHFYEAAL